GRSCPGSFPAAVGRSPGAGCCFPGTAGRSRAGSFPATPGSVGRSPGANRRFPGPAGSGRGRRSPDPGSPEPVSSVAPFGGTNRNCSSPGVAKLTWVNPTSNAGWVACLAMTCTRSGTECSASTAIRTWPTSERVSLGASTSSYARRWATIAVPSMLTSVLWPASASAWSAACCGGCGGGVVGGVLGGWGGRGCVLGPGVAAHRVGGEGAVGVALAVAVPGPHVPAVADDVALAEHAQQRQPYLARPGVPDPHRVRAADQ